jgi:DHA1 family tetracycline resistance protein-like MFS transporter
VLAWRVSARLPAVTTAAPPPTIEPAVVSDADEIIVQPAPLRD